MVDRYHDDTKHHFHRFARSLGYLDWASQPNPFRFFDGAPVVGLWPSQLDESDPYQPTAANYDELYDASTRSVPLTAGALGDLLRHALGLSAWKRYRESHWSLRVNPSSGNLHPTEAYIICGPIAGSAPPASPRLAAVYHYGSDRHVFEQRCAFDAGAWRRAWGDQDEGVLVALTSIHWREAWKYGERAFRYCQHDLGHAIAALRLSAAMLGWGMTLLPQWPQRAIAALIGVDRDEDYVDAEREEPECLLAVGCRESEHPSLASRVAHREVLLNAVRAGVWTGRASQLSEDHVEWTFIDEVARATEDPGRQRFSPPAHPAPPSLPAPLALPAPPALDARRLIVQRRSALAFDGRSGVDAAAFRAMLVRVMPRDSAPWDALWWDARIHLALFVHRVDGVEPGLYLLPRDPASVGRMQAAFGREFLWEDADDTLPLLRLARGDCRRLSKRLSCDQDIAADGFFSLGMIADFEASLNEFGPAFYRHLFWESGLVGQVLYLEAEAAGARATGIGCFYDDPVHEALGLEGHAFQSLYHFTVGMPVEDARLTTEPGYPWEGR